MISLAFYGICASLYQPQRTQRTQRKLSSCGKFLLIIFAPGFVRYYSRGDENMGDRLAGFLILLIMAWFLIINIVAQSTPTPDGIEVALFPDDNCENTCWMGLIPGESTAADVEQVLDELGNQLSYWSAGSQNNVMDPDTGYLIYGDYQFRWQLYSGNNYQQPASLIAIENSIIDVILISADGQITLDQVLNVLGQPDDIQFARTRLYYLTLVYVDKLMQIRFIIPEGCTINTLDEDSEVWVVYHSFKSASELIETDYGLQPRLIAYAFPKSLERQVSLEIFNSWLNSDDDFYCIEAWQTLPETIELPRFPKPEATESPRSSEKSSR
jgi:hypothetical protein